MDYSDLNSKSINTRHLFKKFNNKANWGNERNQSTELSSTEIKLIETDYKCIVFISIVIF